jgi:TolB protein
MTISRLPPSRLFGCCAGLCCVLALVTPTPGASQTATSASDQPLPTRIVIDVSAPERDLYRIAIPSIRGGSALGESGAEIIRNDLRLVSLFNVLNPRSFIANLEQEGLGITKAPWSSVGAQGVVKGAISAVGDSIFVDMRLYEIARGEAPIVSRTYRGTQAQLRGFMHEFANEILRALTGTAGSFGTRVTFTRKVGPGRKDVYISDFDGANQARVSSGKGIAMLPTFGALKGIWYSILASSSMYITNTKNAGKPVIKGGSLNMGATICNGRVFFSSTRDGNSEIYSATTEGTDVRRLTNDPSIDVSPSCGPNGQIAFVSSRHGGPQIFVMDGSGQNVKRVSYKGYHNQTPSFCMAPNNPLIAFSGLDSTFDIFTVNLKTGQYTRLTQGQGNNQDPSFSPDCRMVAFASSRGGIFIASPEGLNQTKVLSGALSNVRWSRE